ncbi:MAG: hypothetical protein M1608_18390 [Candidatus Omnitrophica bacterium]|nr:hypothetical protein [Candidatus Omnitrophota bacterium]
MNLLPIVRRELRLAARRSLTYYARVLAAAVAIFITLGTVYASLGAIINLAMVGRGLFRSLSLLGFAFVLIEGAFSTADCLSREKREGTLGLLFLTDLSGFDVVAGKLMSHPWNSLYCLLAALPALGLAFFIGGITAGDFIRVALALMNALFFSATLGALVSVLSYRERNAIGTALAGALIIGGVIPSIGYLLMNYMGTTAIDPVFLVPSPAGAAVAALFPALVPASAGVFGWSLLTTHLMGWGFLASASLVLPRIWRETGSPGFWHLLFHRVNDPASGTAARRRSRKVQGPAGDDPWYEVNPAFRLGLMPGRWGMTPTTRFLALCLVWVSVLFVYARWLVPASVSRTGLSFPQNWLNPPLFIGAAFLFHYILRFAVAGQACRALAEDRRTGVLELLLTTPLGVDDIIRGRLLAIKRQFFFPTLIVLGMDLLPVLTGLVEVGNAGEMMLIIAVFSVAAAFLMADMYVLAWVGLWCGLKAKNAGRAIRQTVFDVLLLPWLFLLGSVAFLAIISHGQFTPRSGIPWFSCVLPVFIISNISLAVWASGNLRDRFRAVAAR